MSSIARLTLRVNSLTKALQDNIQAAHETTTAVRKSVDASRKALSDLSRDASATAKQLDALMQRSDGGEFARERWSQLPPEAAAGDPSFVPKPPDWYGGKVGGAITDDYALELIKEHAGRQQIIDKLFRGEGATADRAKLIAMNKIGMSRLEGLFERIFSRRFGALRDLSRDYQQRLQQERDRANAAEDTVGFVQERLTQAERELDDVLKELAKPLGSVSGAARGITPPATFAQPQSPTVRVRQPIPKRPANTTRRPNVSTGRYRL